MKEVICVIADGYPFKESNHCVFVRDLVVELARKNVECFVIVPQMMMSNKQYLPYTWDDEVDGVTIRVYAPKYRAFSSKPGLMAITMRNHRNTVMRVIEKEKLNPTVYYGHFLYLNGLTATFLATRSGLKSIIACGENTNRLLPNSKPYATGRKYHGWKRILSKTDGYICVSKENKRLLIESGFISEDKRTCVIPNAVNTDVFKPLNRDSIRKELGIQESDFVVAFTGAFIQRKGNQRVDEAAVGLNGVKTLFIGGGEFSPKSDCIYCGSVKHDLIPYYLSAADVFVLPTTGEGCCNAIIEAICCGLPIVSSKGKFNDDLLNDTYSLRVDPLSVSEIKEAILKLRCDKDLHDEMKKNTLLAAKSFSLSERAQRVLNFIKGV